MMGATLTTHKQASHDELEDAWRLYMRSLEEFRGWLLDQPFAGNPVLRAQAQNLVQQIQGLAFTLYGASRVDYPLIRSQAYFTPMIYSWAFPNSDFIYGHVFLDGSRTYRITGKLGTARIFNSITYHSSFWGDEEKTEFSQDYSMFDFADADGNIDILLGPDASGPGQITLKPEYPNIYIGFREAVADWAKDTAMRIAIERIDDAAPALIVPDDQEMAARIRRCARFIAYNRSFMTKHWSIAFRDGKWDSFHGWGYAPQTSRELHGNPAAQYHYLAHDFAQDEALLVEMPDPRCAYWGLQMGDLWFQASEYSFHQASLNDAQFHPDGDGRIRLVIAHRDPGVPNWLDTVAPVPGIALLRTYGADHEVLAPNVTRLRLADLRDHLPAGTPAMTPLERAQTLKLRARSSLARYGYFPDTAA
jgi:hypothetical protein